MRLRRVVAVMTLGVGALLVAVPRLRAEPNFGDRRPLIVANCPFVELSGLSFRNLSDGQGWLFEQSLAWRNTSPQGLVAVEVVILKYDAYNRRRPAVDWSLTGRGGNDWTPLGPGESSRDLTRAAGQDDAYTEIAWVRRVRLQDGTIWEANEAEVLRDAHRAAPDIRDLGELRSERSEARSDRQQP
jgi:hypothetical protein